MHINDPKLSRIAREKYFVCRLLQLVQSSALVESHRFQDRSGDTKWGIHDFSMLGIPRPFQNCLSQPFFYIVAVCSRQILGAIWEIIAGILIMDFLYRPTRDIPLAQSSN